LRSDEIIFLSSLRSFAPRLCGSSEALRAGVLGTAIGIWLDVWELMQGVFCTPGPEAGPRAAEPQRKGTQRGEKCYVLREGRGGLETGGGPRSERSGLF